MASFLDNSGDIILDAVLTDYGRKKLAAGDGSFNITKFAFGDDEIDYGLFDITAATGPLQDATLMSTPVLEAFTNNAASLKSKLLSIPDNTKLFLPILAINTTSSQVDTYNSVYTGYVVPVDTSALTSSTVLATTKYYGNTNRWFNIEQGLDSIDLSPTTRIEASLLETEYNIFIDDRLGYITTSDSITEQLPVAVDDDSVATYKFSNDNTTFVENISIDQTATSQSIIKGHKGTRLKFNIKPRLGLQTTNTLFTKLGSELSLVSGSPFRVIKTSVKIVGVNTGYTLDIPVLFAKLK
jgi:hypothetical protein